MARTNENDYIIVNGVKMTIKEWKQSVADKQKDRRGKKRFLKTEKPKAKKKTKVTEISLVAMQVQNLLKPQVSIWIFRNVTSVF